jgi:ubiquinone/menaquinone biosynthesis C-methylase UbiE
MSAIQDLANAEAEQLAQWERRIQGLIKSKGGTLTAQEFHRAMNVVFHDVEASLYDENHLEMWDSLGPIFDRLAADILQLTPEASNWALADIGCGTGLASQFVLRTPLQSRFTTLQMVDTSAEMLTRCRARAAGWGVPTTFVHGQIDALPDLSADFLITSSVLHHIPNLFTFCREIERVLKPGGFYLHIQDPRRGAHSSPAVAQRSARLSDARRHIRLRTVPLPVRITHAIVRRIRRLFGKELQADYLDEVNRRLIAAGLIKKQLTPREIWSITDLRVGDLPYSAVDGICPDEMAQALPHCDCVSIRTYCFFGVMPSHLPPDLAVEERRLLDESSRDGAYLAGVWVRSK